MKFLCVPCDSPMRLRATDESEPGSLSVVYACPACGYEMAMLTNQHETDMVRSLGVRIGPAAAGVARRGPRARSPESPPKAARGCARVQECRTPARAPSRRCASPQRPSRPSDVGRRSAACEAIPEMVRPMARAGIEMVARESGHQLIDETVLAAARSRFGM